MPPGPPPKPRDQRKRRNADEGTSSTSIVIPTDGAVSLADDPANAELVKPQGRWLKQTKTDWSAFWASPLASVFRVTDVPSLRRLFHLYDDEERIRRRLLKKRMVTRAEPVGMDGIVKEGEIVLDKQVRGMQIPGHLGVGSQGQLTVSPDFQALKAIRAEIRALEDRLGMTPMARYRMGWQQAEMMNSQARANEAAAMAAAADRIAERHEQLRGGG